MKTFENWFNELEQYCLKSERAYDELVDYPEKAHYTAKQKWNVIYKWLKAAFLAGVASQKNTLDSYKREVRMLREELAEAKGKNMKIQNKKEIELSSEDITIAIMRYLSETQNISLDSQFIIHFRVVNKPINSSVYPSDSMDHHVFDGAKVVVLE